MSFSTKIFSIIQIPYKKTNNVNFSKLFVIVNIIMDVLFYKC